MYIVRPIDNRVPEALFTKGGPGACYPGKNFFNFGSSEMAFP